MGLLSRSRTSGGAFSRVGIRAKPSTRACFLSKNEATDCLLVRCSVSPGVTQSRCDPVDGCAQGEVKLGAGIAVPLAAQQFQLNEAHGVHIWIAQAYGAVKHRIVFEQTLLTSYV